MKNYGISQTTSRRQRFKCALCITFRWSLIFTHLPFPSSMWFYRLDNVFCVLCICLSCNCVSAKIMRMHDSNLETQGIVKIFFIMALQKAWHILQVNILNSSWPKWQHRNWVSVLRAFWGKVIVNKIHPLISKHVDVFSCYLWWWLLMILCFCQIIIVMNTSRPRPNSPLCVLSNACSAFQSRDIVPP